MSAVVPPDGEDQSTTSSGIMEASGSTHLIDITPHHGAMTKAGRANFNRFSDGSAEFIDNSLQAYKQASVFERRDIRLRLFLNDKKGSHEKTSSYIVFADFGCGMNAKDLREFATYSLDKETRNQQKEEYISKFGVGAKQSGFFLGDRIRVITRRAGGPVLELVLDENDFEERRLAGRKVFETEIKERHHAAENRQMYCPDDELRDVGMQRFITQWETGHFGDDPSSADHAHPDRHFTIIIVRLKSQRVNDLKTTGRYREVPYELAQIYHFHLHPDNVPQKVIELAKFRFGKKLTNESILNEMSEPIRERYGARAVDALLAQDPPLNIYFAAFQNGAPLIDEVNLRELHDEVSDFVDKAKAVFRFNMAFPDPEQNTVGELNIANRVSGDINRSTVQGMIFYYPYDGDKESRPHAANRRVPALTPDEGLEVIAYKSQMTPGDRAIDSEDVDDPSEEIAEERREQSMFDCYWVNRLVPQSSLKRVPLFPKGLVTAAQCESAGVPTSWRNRLKGFIFFEHSWEYISNNKLKIQVDPDIDTYINNRCDDKGSVTFTPPHATSKFKTWLKACHDEFDRETHFKERLELVEQACRSFQLRNASISCKDTAPFDSALFRTLDVGGTHNQLNLRVGDNVKLFVTRKSNKISQKSYIFAKILAFEVPSKDLCRTSREHFGRGCIRYLRLPLPIYHPSKPDSRARETLLLPNGEEFILKGIGFTADGKSSKLKVLDEHFFANKPIPMQAIVPDDCRPTDKEIMALFDEFPHSVKVMLYETVTAKPVVMNAKTTMIESNKSYYKVAVQILTPKKSLCSIRPQTSSTTDRYKVRFSITKKMDANGNFRALPTPKYFGETKDYWRYDKNSQKEEQCYPWEPSNKYKDAALCLYGSSNVRNSSGSEPSLRFTESGTFELEVCVLDGDAIVLTENVKLCVKGEPIADFNLEFTPVDGEDPTSFVYPIGADLPELHIAFKDRSGNPFLFDDAKNVLIQIDSDKMEVCARYGESQETQLVRTPIYRVSAATDEGGRLLLESFESKPKNDAAFMPVDASDCEVRYSVSVLMSPNEEHENSEEAEHYTHQVGPTKTFKINYRAGEAYRLIPIESGKFSAINGERVPSLRFTCADRWGNRTKPRQHGETWKALLIKNDDVKGESSTDEQANVQASGEVDFSHLIADSEKLIAAQGLQVTLDFELELTKPDGTITRIPAQKKDKAGVVRRLAPPVLSVTLLLENNKSIPAKMVVYRDGIQISAGIYDVFAGAVISGLTASVLNSNDEVITKLPRVWLNAKACGLILWSESGDSQGKWSSRSKPVMPSDEEASSGVFFLPDIHLPSKAATFEYEMKIKLSQGKNKIFEVDPFSFSVTSKPGVASSWRMISNNLDEGIRVGESRDLYSKVLGILLVDEVGNCVSWAEGAYPLPVCSINFDLPRTDTITGANAAKRQRDSRSTPNGKRRRSEKEKRAESDEKDGDHDMVRDDSAMNTTFNLQLEPGLCISEGSSTSSHRFIPLSEASKTEKKNGFLCFILRRDVQQELSIPTGYAMPPPIQASICISSSADRAVTFADVSKRFSIVSGFANRVVFKCDALNISDFTHDGSAEVDVLTDVHLSIYFTDKSCLWPGDVDTKSFKNAVFTVEHAGTGAELFSKKLGKFSQTLEVPLSFSSFKEAAANFDLQCGFSYEHLGQKVKCSPAVLHCTLQKLNNVTKIELTLHNSHSLRESLPAYSAKHAVPMSIVVPASRAEAGKYFCYEGLPTLRLKAVTDRDSSYVPPLESLTFSLALQGDRVPQSSKSTIRDPRKAKNLSQSIAAQVLQASLPIFDYYEQAVLGNATSSDASGGYIELVPKLPTLISATGKRKAIDADSAASSTTTSYPPDTGDYKITVQYKEEREQFKSLPDAKRTIIEVVNFRIRPDFPVALQIEDPSMFDSALAGNFVNGSVRSRQIAPSLVRVICIDSYGNRSTFPADCTVVASIRKPGNGGERGDLPMLDGTVDGKLLGAAVPSADGKEIVAFAFSRLQLLPGVGSAEQARLQVVFSFGLAKDAPCSIAGVDVVEMAESAVYFEFVSDASRAEKQKVLTDKLAPLQSVVSDHSSAREIVEGERKVVLNQLRAEMKSFKTEAYSKNSLLSTLLDSAETLDTSRLKDAERELEGELRLFADHRHRPAIKDESKLPNLAACREVDCIGLTVDLGYVEDERVAKALSHAAGHYMNTMICKDDKSALSLFNKGIRSWSLSRMKTFSGSNGQHKKNDSSKGELALPQISHEGNPRYMVNIIQLDEEHEYLRDTLFFAIFDRTLLFDTKETALAYQKKMIDNKQRPPTIVTLDGDKFTPDGLLNPSAKMSRKLPFVFGELPLVRNSSVRSFEGQLAKLKRLLVLVEQRDVADNKFRQLQGEYDEINRARSEISLIQKQLEELGA